VSLQKRFIKSLNERKTSSKDILERLERDRLVVDLSSVRQEERRYLVASVLRSIWNHIDERKQPVNTLVVVDEAPMRVSRVARHRMSLLRGLLGRVGSGVWGWYWLARG